jgi:ATP-dependent DNA ligase
MRILYVEVSDLAGRFDKVRRAVQDHARQIPDADVHFTAPAQWVKPLLVAEVAFQEWTAAGQLRHPSFVGVRPLA